MFGNPDNLETENPLKERLGLDHFCILKYLGKIDTVQTPEELKGEVTDGYNMGFLKS